MADKVTPDTVVPLLRGRLGHPYRYVERCASTQRLLGDEDPEGAAVATDEQTEGRGRLGRSWQAPPGTSILCSVLLRPPVQAQRLPELSLVAGRAVAAAIAAETGLEPELKLPNDLLLRGRKVAGILAEASEGRVVLGIGVNVQQTADQLPQDASLAPTSLRLEGAAQVRRAPLLAKILLQLERELDVWIKLS